MNLSKQSEDKELFSFELRSPENISFLGRLHLMLNYNKLF